MRIGIVSDSHKNLYMLDKAISQMGKVDMLIHLGDDYRDIIKVNEKHNLEIHYVIGNNDYSSEPIDDKLVEVHGKRIYITHGHRYDVYYGVDKLYFKAIELNADIILYGHTHKQRVDWHGERVFLNPGSVSLPRDAAPGYAVIEVDELGKFEIKTFRFEA